MIPVFSVFGHVRCNFIFLACIKTHRAIVGLIGLLITQFRHYIMHCPQHINNPCPFIGSQLLLNNASRMHISQKWISIGEHYSSVLLTYHIPLRLISTPSPYVSMSWLHLPFILVYPCLFWIHDYLYHLCVSPLISYFKSRHVILKFLAAGLSLLIIVYLPKS